jgi:8-oxo-dGTP diphosphatase
MIWPSKKQHLVKATVGAIIVKQDEERVKILLTQRGYPPFQGRWCLPGGHIDPDESAQQAIIREVQEEVGLSFDARFFGYFDEIIPELDIHAVVLIFTGKTTGQLQAQPGEVTELEWFSLTEAQSLSLAFQHNLILEAYKKSISSQNIKNV